jgi:hypothetical protein
MPRRKYLQNCGVNNASLFSVENRFILKNCEAPSILSNFIIVYAFATYLRWKVKRHFSVITDFTYENFRSLANTSSPGLTSRYIGEIWAPLRIDFIDSFSGLFEWKNSSTRTKLRAFSAFRRERLSDFE